MWVRLVEIAEISIQIWCDLRTNSKQTNQKSFLFKKGSNSHDSDETDKKKQQINVSNLDKYCKYTAIWNLGRWHESNIKKTTTNTSTTKIKRRAKKETELQQFCVFWYNFFFFFRCFCRWHSQQFSSIHKNDSKNYGIERDH